ncbi:filamentous hemagglutinin N-terminal domain-containing protein [Nostoc sp. UHCC 0251]|uniref:two-partner secretion domain-containing protein n=1 Tax=Nostoc sp. UHCC 0251 TaxID=3110240 RepID=UPI002B2205DC|nr:filamentous hemagglutinin N-terminal domain-containing protein [Nostoc sp. UHCC 0251]MEA5622212.1 filamentous hemagglutinin N-terminal domain-containing protein [Nostoc sp. UHCC 0251]
MNNSRNFTQSQAGLFLLLGTVIPIAVVSILASNACIAQIIPDTTLGNESSRVTTGVNVKEHGADLIEGGAQRGSSLFHSFAEFNVNNGQRLYFANPMGIGNIFSRVTGSNTSNILGTLGVNGAANLFLLNPNGIIFGPNAQLDIQGSFLATTANSFQFSDGSEFSASNPQAPPLLTMSVPVGVQYGLQQTVSITNQGNLVTGKDLTLSAGNLDLQGTLQAGGDLILQAQDTLTVRDSSSNPFIAVAGGNLLAQGNQKVDIFALNNPNSGFFSGGNMVLQSENTIGGDAHYWAGGNFRIEQLNGNLGNLFSPYDPVIRASGDVSFDSYEGASLHILAGGSVNISGDVTITGVDSTSNSIEETVTLSDGKTLDIDGSATPTLDIRAGVNSNYIGTPEFTPNLPIEFNGQNLNITNEPTNANITIQGSIYNLSGYESNSGQILITNQYNPNKLLGNITTGEILTYGDVTLDSRYDITTNGAIDTTNTDFFGQNNTAGNIRLLANQNILISGDLLSSFYDTTNNDSGYSGSIVINAPGQISLLNGSKIKSEGNFGYIDINADSLYLEHASEINTDNSSESSGSSGYITINASKQISVLNDSKISSNGNFGNINIKTDSLYLDHSSEINTDNSSGYAGDITINASKQISVLNDSKISSQGDLGIIIINTNSLSLNQNSEINTTNDNGLGYAGYISIDASDQISILNNSKISSNGNYGYIDITTSNLSLTNGAQISSSLGSAGNQVGYIDIKAKDTVLLQGNSTLGDTATNQTGIFTEIKAGGKLPEDRGKGNITLKTGKLIINDGARLSADTYGNGNAGDIEVNAQQIDLSNQGRIISVVREKADGNSGNIKLNSRTLSITDDARISVSNLGTGNAGNITINALNSMFLERKGRISSSVRSTATGKGGNINIDTNFLTADGGIIESQNQGQGDGGNIAIKTQNLLLRRQSKISATAGSTTNPGNGGRITIDAKDGFVIAVPSEDSDIIANAFGGKGGRIEINANRILGFQNREKLSSEQLRKLDKNSISEISASSDVGQNGEVSLKTLSIDPSQGLVALPTNLVDPSRLISQGCGSNSSVAKGQSEFVITGRGGLPPSPDDTLRPGAILPEWVVNNTVNYSNNPGNMTVKEMNLRQLSSNTSAPLVEAVGMVRSANGDIVLTTQPTTATLLQSGLSTKVCGAVQGNVRE